MELSELIGQAQVLMDDGAYTRASVLCEHGLEHYPACLTLQRMLGECLLEQRFVDKAIERFQAALNVDPLSVLGRLGMGVAAEEKQDFEAAYACYLHAWEINPALQHVRDRLVKLRQMLGVDPRLHLTRAGLASVHLRAGQYDRAIAELRALTLADPDARRIRTMLAEAHWRKGDDASAAALCREGLEHSPDNARYLGLLSEIQQRQSSPDAADFVARYQASDPMGEIASLMMEWRADRDVSHLFRESAPLPEPAAAPVEIEAPVTLVMEPAKVAAPEFTDAAAHREPALAYSGGKVTAGLDKSIQPFVWDETPVASATGAAWDDWSNPAPPVGQAATASSPSANGGSSTTTSSPSPFVTADGRLDLTAGWDDLDKALRDATPQTGPLSNYTGLLSQLSVEGIAPFDASEVKGDESAWEPLFEPDGGTGLLGGPIIPAPGRRPGSTPLAAAQPPREMAAPTPPAPAPEPLVASAPVAAPEPEAAAKPAVAPEPTAPPAMVAAAPVAQASVEAELAPFSFEDVDGGYADRGMPAHAFDDPTADLGGPRQSQTGSLLEKPTEAMASALDAMFSDDASVPNSRGAAARPTDRGSSVFDLLRASKTRPASQPEPEASLPVEADEKPSVAATRDELPKTTVLSPETLARVAEAPAADSLVAVAAEMKAAMADASAAETRDVKHIETSELEAWVEANGGVVEGPAPAETAITAMESAPVEDLAPVVAPVAPVAEVSAAAPVETIEPVAVLAAEVLESEATGATEPAVPAEAEAMVAEGVDEIDGPAMGSPDVEEAAAETVAIEASVDADEAAEAAAMAELAAPVGEAVVAVSEPSPEAEPLVVAAETDALQEPSAPMVDGAAMVEPPAEASPPIAALPGAEAAAVFHVKPAPVAARSRVRRAPSIDLVELMAMKARLVDADGAASVVAELQPRLAGASAEPAVARLLGEAHLVLGQPSRAAAHFRQAMLYRSRVRADANASSAR